MSEQRLSRTLQQTIDLALQYHQTGDLSSAKNHYEQIINSHPEHPVALHYLGVIAYQEGNNDHAITLIKNSLRVMPNYAEAHNNLGKVYEELNQLEIALEAYQFAVTLDSGLVESRFNAANVLQKMGRLLEAETQYQKVLEEKNNYPEVYCAIGDTLRKLGRLVEAAQNYKSAIKLQPNYSSAHNNLGVSLQRMGHNKAASDSYKIAISLNPNNAEFHNNLGSAAQNMRKFDTAIASYKKAIELNPRYAQSHLNLSSLFHTKGQMNEASEELTVAISMDPNKAGWIIKKALLLPPIPKSEADIRTARNALIQTIADLSKQNISIDDPIYEVGTTGFYLSYHNQNNKPVMQSLAKLFIKACPSLVFESEHCRPERRKEKRILRVGFISTFFRNHTIGKLAHGLIKYLSRDRFEVFVFRPVGMDDRLSKIIDSCADKVVALTGALKTDHEIVASAKLDILYYPEIGMSPHMYFMAFARLAPIQVTTWGHPDTTGIPNVDYYLSSKLIEIADASGHYSEQLVTLNTVPTYYVHPDPPKNKYTASDYGLPTDVRLYVCPQTLFKFHPEFDDLLGKLLRRDPKGRLILIGDNKEGSWNKLLLQRFYRSFPEVVDSVIFIPRMAHEKFLGLLVIADALLDIPSFSGGNSSLEAFAVGAPIVTWPQNFMRSRVTAALYKQMGLNTLIARNSDSYLKLSFRLANNKTFQGKMREEIKNNSFKLFNTLESTRDLETFFTAAHNAWQTHSSPTELVSGL